MAHKNIEERRKAVEIALGDKSSLPTSKRKELAREFNCTPAAILADVLTLVNGSVFKVSSGMKAKIISRDGNICYICGNYTPDPVIEHKIPARAGGRPIESNLAVACQSCNMKKVAKDAILYPV